MQIAMKRLGILALAICLLAALMFGWHSVARAEGSWWKTPDNNDLTVYASGDKELQKDLADAEAYVNLFKIADAVPEGNYEAFRYKYLDAYGSGYVPMPGVDDADAKEKWQEIARQAALKVESGDSGPTVGGGDFSEDTGYNVKMSELEDGIYLAVIFSHIPGAYEWEKDESGSSTGSTTIKSARNEYTFKPQLIALPSKAAVGDVIATSNPGAWLQDVTVVLKPEVKWQYGSIKITKSIQNFDGNQVTFTYYLAGTTPSGDTWDNYAAITCTSSTGETTVTHIPAGTKLTVTEIDPGAAYELVSGDTSEKTIIANSEVTAAFVNKWNGSGVRSSGIQNNFELTEDGDWKWTPSPAQSGSGE